MKLSRLVVLSACLAAASASAQNLRPGLWEMNNQVKGGSSQNSQLMAEAQKQMANMSPAQRKMVDEMMGRHGVGLNVGADGGLQVTYCMTKEMSERKELPTGQQGQCQTSSTPIAGGMNVQFTCTQPASSGSGQVLIHSDTAYTMTMNVVTSATGKPESMAVQGSGRWVGADCGSKGKAVN